MNFCSYLCRYKKIGVFMRKILLLLSLILVWTGAFSQVTNPDNIDCGNVCVLNANHIVLLSKWHLFN